MTTPPTVEEAIAFADAADAELLDAVTRAERAAWVHATYITDDTARITAEATQALGASTARLAGEAVRFVDLDLPDDVARRLMLLKIDLPEMAGPAEGAAAELASVGAWLEGAYSTWRHAPRGRSAVGLDDLSTVLRESRDPDELLDVWTGWHAVGRQMREPYRRYVELMNDGARSLGYVDNGERWRSSYDMAPEAFEQDMDRLWGEARSLYLALHAYVRHRLLEAYGGEVVPSDGPIPVHLLGDMWAQDWTNVADLVAPPDGWGDTEDTTALLVRHGYDPIRMIRTGEAFFTSLGFEPLPDTFWTRSMFVRPADREVVCHPSAWTIGEDLDLRLKMCTQVTGQDFVTIHHELGHLFYMRAYRGEPFLFRSSANDGFHEAIGDAVALSITPDYLERIGLLDAAPGPDGDIGLLLRQALQTVPRLAWELALERWRWGVFSGSIPFDDWNRAWWELRLAYQGVAPSVERTEEDFDPGAKYHIPANTPYIRYYLAVFLQYQFHQAMSEAAGLDGPLHRRSIYGSRAAGDRLAAMLEMGRRRPWPDALEAMTGTRTIEATPLLEYFAPLHAWLDARNEGQPVGW